MPHTPSHRWEDFEDQYRADWERSYPNTPWNDTSYGYRYGWERAHDPSYANHSWDEAEPNLLSSWNDWQASHRAGSLGQQIQQAWEDIKESVRHGWERAKREADWVD